MPAPSNDALATAEVLSSPGTISGTTVDATSDAFEQSAYGASVLTVWYRWDNTSGVNQDFTFENTTADSPELDDLIFSLWSVETANFPADAEELFTFWGGVGEAAPSDPPIVVTDYPDGWSIIVLVYTASGGQANFGFDYSTTPSEVPAGVQLSLFFREGHK